MIRMKNLNLLCSRADLADLPEGKLLINTINAFSYNNARKDVLFEEALTKGDVLIPDGISIVRTCHLLKAKSRPKERIAGWDLFTFEMHRLNKKGGKVMFLGSSEKVLGLIQKNAASRYPNLEVVTYSPPYKPQFTVEDDLNRVKAINDAYPDLLWIGMTATKQEKWMAAHRDRIKGVMLGVGAGFDFHAGTIKRAPLILQKIGLEWLYRLFQNPKRLVKRYLITNTKFILYTTFRKG
jgi:N-acetylglucosaminyldiphosphoundecaprenol N-acetyl-beta-D-mannosaminyltransferase